MPAPAERPATPPEVLSGPEEPALSQRLRDWTTHHRAVAVVAMAAVLGLAVPSALLVARSTAPADRRVAGAAVVADIAVRPDPEDGGAPGALGSPAGTAVPGKVVVLDLDSAGTAVAATPQVDRPAGPGVRVTPLAPTAPGGSAGEVPPEGSGSLRVAVSPVDCADEPTADGVGAEVAQVAGVADDGPRNADDDGPRHADDDASRPAGAAVAPDVIGTLLGVWRETCSLLPAPSIVAAATAGPEAGPGPSTTTLTLDLSGNVPLDGGRLSLVVTPLDAAGRRGLGSVERKGPGPVEVVWSTDRVPAGPARVQVFAVRGRTALPFLLDVPAR